MCLILLLIGLITMATFKLFLLLIMSFLICGNSFVTNAQETVYHLNNSENNALAILEVSSEKSLLDQDINIVI